MRYRKNKAPSLKKSTVQGKEQPSGNFIKISFYGSSLSLVGNPVEIRF